MSQIDKLIAALCSNGIEFKTLGNIARFVRGNGMPKSDLTEDGVGAIHYGQIYTRYGAWARATISFVSEATATKLAKVDPGDIVITNTSENIEDVGKAVAWLGDEQIVTGGHATVIKHAQDPKYLSYWFQSRAFFDQKRALATGTKVIDVSARQLEKVRIPVPPLEVQREIVRVLDKFTQLEAELEAELEARRRQYEYYLDRLVSFRGENEVPWVAIGDLGLIFRGKRFTKSDYVDSDGIGVIHYGEIYTRYGTTANQAVSQVRPDLGPALRYAYKGDVILTDVGETVEDVGKAVAWLGEEPVAVHDHCYVIRSELDASYLAYTMQGNDFRKAKEQAIARTKVKTLLLDGLKRIKVPIPPLEEQRRIVLILDKFDSLVNDLSIGLPAELEARRKQYEYYRDRLLTFEEKR